MTYKDKAHYDSTPPCIMSVQLKICMTWLLHMCDVTSSCVSRDSFISVIWFSYAWHDTFICVTWLLHTCDVTPSYVWHDSFKCVRLASVCNIMHAAQYMRDVTYFEAWHDSIICVTRLLHMRDVTISHVRHQRVSATMSTQIRMCVTRVQMCDVTSSYVCDVTPSYAWHDTFICVTELIHMCDGTHSYVRR